MGGLSQQNPRYMCISTSASSRPRTCRPSWQTNDFATSGDKGVRGLHGQKLAIREFIQEPGVPYTFIDVGWWMQLSLPLPERSRSPLKERLDTVYGDGNGRMLATNFNRIGTYVAWIIADPRTLNHAVHK
ncbi:hypothetical protein GY45DRAFT_1427116 [Cubamyces sp. BRFM 1775]|nr:hypothetical protein GY45DRAFT_1427116 [Cubamyces sp. BRFM 1775]